MTVTSPARLSTTTALGGAPVLIAGLLPLLVLLGVEGRAVLMPVATVALALGAVVLARREGGVAGGSRVGRVALVVFGVGPLVFSLFSAPPPWAVLIGMSLIVLITAATVLSAVAVARAQVLHGVARWALVAVAADALLTAALSSIPAEALPQTYLGLHLELLRPLLLLVWGGALVLHGRGPAICRRTAELGGAWRRSTDVGGTAPGAAPDRTARR